MCEWVASEALYTRADWRVVDNLTLRVDATHASAGVDTAVVDTGAGPGAVSGEHTLGATPGVRVPRVVGAAAA